MRKYMDCLERMNDVLVNLFRDINSLEERALATSDFDDLTINDIHVIDAIGIGEPKNMTAIAKELYVTVGTLTIAMNSLVKKGYVDRNRSEKDRRRVNISLTAKGRSAYENHARFHKAMVDKIAENLNADEMEFLRNLLVRLTDFFRSFANTQQN